MVLPGGAMSAVKHEGDQGLSNDGYSDRSFLPIMSFEIPDGEISVKDDLRKFMNFISNSLNLT